MALVNLTNIVVLDNPTSFTNPFTFEVTFECVQELEDGTWLNCVVCGGPGTGGGGVSAGVSESDFVGAERHSPRQELVLVPYPPTRAHSPFLFNRICYSWPVSRLTHSLFLFPSTPTTTDLEWKVLYVSSAENAEQDQVLEEVMVGPVPVGVNKFVLQSEAPDVSRIPEEDIIGVTVILITCSYREQEFVRVGYYVNNEYAEAFDPENPPRPVDLGKLVRNILADKPRVTRFPVDWGLGAGMEGGQQPQVTEEEAAAEGVVDFDALEQQAGEEDEEEEEEGEEGDRDVEGEEDSDEPGGLQGGDAMDMEMASPAFKGSAARGDSMTECPPPYAASS